ncbi:GntR family transcriptional regulator [Sporomusa termitida]|uniref:HTH-type transcriptional repressor RspR n=1 Tax=Sporomusa termitida TaxID=2377 RepID=A0A517DV51_9FIRM|nr:GntR family transcriptional regulator [Sporomusa termitida]QDR81232.1 HTH-type transcriptional repressor RspR [Sporomusa termitida]
MSNNELSLAEKAYITLKEMIITLKLKPGEVVSENEISKLLGIGRMPIREAFKRLESAALVSIIPRRGILITEIKTDEIFLQLEVRAVLEELIVKRACKYATASERERLLQLANQYEQATKDNDRFYAVQIDEQFNQLLGQCSKNLFAWQAIVPFYALSQRIYFYHYESNEELTLEINYAHIDLMKMIAAGEEKEAIQKLNCVLDYTENLIRRNMNTWLPAKE